ncbi:[FeFe] hydrogenase H-cluster maturation GTPase HydF [bacterium]|nr:[FeFe] hydrogenase H-cluster maturation GTPase HydF [bacterium]
MTTNVKSMRWHIGIFGRTNVGKSTFINWLTNQSISIVSEHPGTTTDPVEKTIELLPLGSVVLYDTAGYNDETVLGNKRLEKTSQILDRIDVAMVLVNGSQYGKPEEDWILQLQKKQIPFLVVFNQIDRYKPDQELLKEIEEKHYSSIQLSSISSDDFIRNALKEKLMHLLPDRDWIEKPLLEGLVRPGELIVLVIPIDKSAPKGRIILPQQQVIREVIDLGGLSLTITPDQIPMLDVYLSRKPSLLITDSQAFETVFRLTAKDLPLTSFSILFARQRGGFDLLLQGARQIRRLKENDKVLIMEACSHHPTTDDIGRVKLPRWLNQFLQRKVQTDIVAGHTIPPNLEEYQLVIHCGSCMLNRREVINRISRIHEKGIPVTNYGLAIAEMNGHLERAIEPLQRSMVTV